MADPQKKQEHPSHAQSVSQAVSQASQAATAQGTSSPDPYSDPISYLRAKGWRPLGNPSWPSATWIDPTKPLMETYEKEPIYAPDAKGTPRPVMVDAGDGIPVQGFRTRCHPAGTPVSLQEALIAQMERDHAEEQAKAKAEAEAAKLKKAG